MDIEQIMELILHAGNSESASLMSIEAAREFNFEEAMAQNEIARQELKEAHNEQTAFLQRQALGDHIEMDIYMTHAQDHFAMASVLKNFSDEVINVYKLIQELKEERK